MKRVLISAACLLVFLFVWAATWAAARADEPRELTVFAAASLREVFVDLGKVLEAKRPGLKVRLNLAGSQELRTQIEHGAAADVFASADTIQMAALARAGRVQVPRVFARNSPVIVVPKDNPAGLKSFADLPKARHLVIGTPEVPIGTYTLEILGKAGASMGADFKERVLARVASRELNVRQVLAKVTLGEADAGIVYQTDAKAGKDKVYIIAIPAELNVVAEYPVAVLKSAPQPVAAAAFVDLLLSPEGQKRLSAAGFTVAK